MFLEGVKTAVVEALRSVTWPEPAPRHIDLEYVEEEENWPSILVQFHPQTMRWEGLVPDLVIPNTDPLTNTTYPLTKVQEYYFDGNVDLEILSIKNGERDRIYDTLVGILLGGDRAGNPNQVFFNTINGHDFIAITIQEGTVTPMGDTIGVGAPWNPEVITYEAMIRFNLVGQFYLSQYDQNFVALDSVTTYEYIPDAGQTALPNDSNGNWNVF